MHRLVAVGTDGSGNQVRSAPVNVQLVISPVLHRLTPVNGPTTGGTDVAITGWNFEPSMLVTFAGSPATLTYVDANHVTVNSLHPARSMNTARVINGGFQPLSSVEEGAEATMQLAVSPALVGRSGLYFNGLNEAKANAQAYDTSARAQLRTLSFELTGIAHKS